jgi:hypothetical protein
MGSVDICYYPNNIRNHLFKSTLSILLAIFNPNDITHIMLIGQAYEGTGITILQILGSSAVGNRTCNYLLITKSVFFRLYFFC